MKQPLRPPGPPQRLSTGNFRDFRTDLLGFLKNSAAEYGDVVSFRLGRRDCLLVSNPELIEYVLVKNSRNFVKPFAFRFTRPVLGNGLLTSEGAYWLRQRRLAAPAFHNERIQSYGADMVAAGLRMLDSWQSDVPRDVHADMMQVTLDIVARTLFGADITEQSHDIGESLLLAIRSFGANFTPLPLPTWIPTRGNRRARAAVKSLNRIVQQIIDQRRADTQRRGDLLSMMLHARDDDGSQMTDEQLMDECRTFLLAGHETTAITLSWSLFLLAGHPDVQARLHAELADVLGGRPPQVSDIPRLKYTEQVVLEAMRIYPPVFMIGRENVAPVELGGYAVPAGTTIFMSQWVMHRDARYFDRPEVFDPERWLPERAAAVPKMAYFPFGGGPRICIGNTFAMMESVLLLATIAGRYALSPVPEHPIKLSPVLTLRPRYGIKLVPKRLAPAAHSPSELAAHDT